MIHNVAIDLLNQLYRSFTEESKYPAGEILLQFDMKPCCTFINVELGYVGNGRAVSKYFKLFWKS